MQTQSQRTDFLEGRRSGLGGSDIAAIMGLDPFRTPVDVFRSKVLPQAENDSPLGPMARGRFLEPVIRQMYGQITGRIVTEVGVALRDQAHPELMANIDGSFFDPTTEARGILEAKAPGLNRFGEMKRKGVPEYYYTQIQHYLGVTGDQVAAFAALNAERWDMLQFDVQRDDAAIKTIREFAIFWWQEFVVKEVEPPLEKLADSVNLPEEPGKVVTIATEAWRTAMARWDEAKQLEQMAASLVDEAKAEIQSFFTLSGGSIAEGAGFRVYYTQSAGKRTFQPKELEASKPLDRAKVAKALRDVGLSDKEIVEVTTAGALDLEKFYKLGAGSRSLRVFPLGGKS
jgi:putative phage-type endonuclease